jgi:hypothetical protein
MKGEIDRDYYCSENDCIERKPNKECVDMVCRNCHRKHPTPEHFKEEYGEEWDGACYFWSDEDRFWFTSSKADTEFLNRVTVVCACTPWGKPPNDWRPE